MRSFRHVAVVAVTFASLAFPVAALAGSATIDIEITPPADDSYQMETLEYLDFSPVDIQTIVDNTFSTDDTSVYKFADSLDVDANISATEFPFLLTDTISFGSVTWSPEQLPDTSTGDGMFLPMGDGIVPDRPYLIGIITQMGPLPDGPVGGIEGKNLGLVLDVPGRDGWQELEGVYDFDTWQGGCCILWADYFPNPWTPHITTIGPGNTLAEGPGVNGFVLIHGDTLVFAADQDQLIGEAPPETIRLRTYAHFADQLLGATPDSLSSIQTIPGIGGPETFLRPSFYSFEVGQEPPIEIIEDVLSPVDSPTVLDDDVLIPDDAPTIVENPIIIDDDLALDPGSGPGSAPPGSDPFWPLAAVAGGVVLIGGGEVIRRRGQRAAVAVDPNHDGFLFEALAGLGGGAAETTITSAEADHLWTIAIAPELDAQARIQRAQAEVVRQWTEWHDRFKQALVRFAESYLRAWQGSDALRENQSDWRVHQIGAKAVDLAVALIQLVRGVFMLGRGIAGWYGARSAAKMAAKSADEILALRTAAQEALDASPQLSRFADSFVGQGRAGMKSYRDELVDVIMWGQDAGIDIVSIMARRLDEMADLPVGQYRKLDILIEQMIPHIMRAAGLVEAAPAVANAVENTAGIARVLATEGAALSDEGAAAIRTFVQMVDDTPGFWDDAGNMFVKLARGTDDALTGEVAQLASADRLAGLRAMYDAAKASGGDLSRVPGLFRDAIGPAKATALANGGDAVSAIPSALMQDGVITGAHGAAMAGTDGASGAGTVQVGLGSVDAQMQQYGITGDTFGGNVWDLITSPVETTTGLYYSWGALDEIEDLFENNAEDLSDMSSAWTQLVNALGGLENLSQGGASGHDPIEDLQGALRDLDRAQSGLRDVYDDAPVDWKASNRRRVEDKMAHIDQKTATIQRLIDALQRLKLSIGRLKDQLDSMQDTPDGDRRTNLEWIDPALSQALTQVAFQLEAIGHEVLATD